MRKNVTIFTYWVKNKLKEEGFEPFLEVPNKKHPQYRCWKYENTPEFREALTKVSKEGRDEF